jgi:DNA-binding NarL/FixJ family response regulator
MQNILLIQNDSADSEAVRDALVNSNDGLFRVLLVRDCSAGLAALAKGKARGIHDADRIVAVLVDLSLPDSSGIETFDRILQAAPQVPILILSSAQDEDTAKLAVKRGAQEYLSRSSLTPICGRRRLPA